VDVEVLRKPAGDAGDHAIFAGALEALGRGEFSCGGLFAHGSRVAEQSGFGYPE
jgi:hypothetical protein